MCNEYVTGAGRRVAHAPSDIRGTLHLQYSLPSGAWWGREVGLRGVPADPTSSGVTTLQ